MRNKILTGLVLALSLTVFFCGGGPAPTPLEDAPPLAPATDTSSTSDNPSAAAETTASSDASGPVMVDPDLPSYEKIDAPLRGTLTSVGSDTMNNLMAYWSEGFSRMYPGVKFSVEGKGSSTAPPALIEATAQLGPMSRAMKAKEVDEFEEKYGFKPTMLRAGTDALAVFVHRDNPLQGLDLAQVDAIFSKSRNRGFASDVKTWGDLGLDAGDLNGQVISIYGRNSASGTYGFFKKKALKKGDYKDEVKEQPGSASVVQAIANDKAAVGYSGIGYKTSGVRALPLAEEGAAYVEPTADKVASLDYPLARYLMIYIVKDPNKDLDPVTKEFLLYVFSKEGQEGVAKDGYYPLSATLVAEERAKLD